MEITLGQEDLAALGRIAIASTGIEMIAEQMIWALLGVEEPTGRAVTERAQPSWLAQRLERLATRTNVERGLAEEVAAFARGAKTMFEVRNHNLHGVWISLEEGKAVRLRSVLVDGREGPEFQTDVAVASAGQLSQVANAMQEFGRAGHKLLQRLGQETR